MLLDHSPETEGHHRITKCSVVTNLRRSVLYQRNESGAGAPPATAPNGGLRSLHIGNTKSEGRLGPWSKQLSLNPVAHTLYSRRHSRLQSASPSWAHLSTLLVVGCRLRPIPGWVGSECCFLPNKPPKQKIKTQVLIKSIMYC